MDDVQQTELDAVLRERGFRVTQPRRAVWGALQGVDGHLTVEEVLQRTATLGHAVDLASVYRTLALFEELGLARASRLGDSDASRWELAHPDEHFHLVCEVCGEVDHHIGSLVSSIRGHLDAGHGFEATRIELVVSGRCARCRAAA
jgi:Fur family transcriptional regulator, ferric uptake regulator